MTSTLSELTCLGLRRPGRSASRVELAAYYERMAEIHRHLASESPAESDRELALAAAAHHHALEVTR